mmetsp:Transcript_29941/g.48374  ORF Transcript_29941/g.48374 Transcript_29941/m.48374 type:complete len:83 (+) Transcript_29941:2033-2281(+)
MGCTPPGSLLLIRKVGTATGVPALPRHVAAPDTGTAWLTCTGAAHLGVLGHRTEPPPPRQRGSAMYATVATGGDETNETGTP